MNTNNWIQLPQDVEILRTTAKAVLFSWERGALLPPVEMWAPKSAVKTTDDPKWGELHYVKHWLIAKNNLWRTL